MEQNTITLQQTRDVNLKLNFARTNYISFTPSFSVDTNSIESDFMVYVNDQKVTTVLPSKFSNGGHYVSFREADGGHNIFSQLNEQRLTVYNAVIREIEQLNVSANSKCNPFISRIHNVVKNTPYDTIIKQYKGLIHITTGPYFTPGELNRMMNLEIKLKSVSVATPFSLSPTIKLNWVIANMYSTDNSDLGFLDPVIEARPLSQLPPSTQNYVGIPVIPGIDTDAQMMPDVDYFPLLPTPANEELAMSSQTPVKRGRLTTIPKTPKAPKKPKLTRSNAMPY